MTTVTHPTPTSDAVAAPWASEQMITCHDDRVGLRAVIAIDDTTLGPGFGGVRYRAYPSTEAAAREAQRLAAAMTLKHALAELPYGGAKSVVMLDGEPAAPGSPERRALFARFGEMIARGGVNADGTRVDIAPTVDTRELAPVEDPRLPDPPADGRGGSAGGPVPPGQRA